MDEPCPRVSPLTLLVCAAVSVGAGTVAQSCHAQTGNALVGLRYPPRVVTLRCEIRVAAVIVILPLECAFDSLVDLSSASLCKLIINN